MNLPHLDGPPSKHVKLLPSKNLSSPPDSLYIKDTSSIDSPKFACTLQTPIAPQFQGQTFASFSAMVTASQKHK